MTASPTAVRIVTSPFSTLRKFISDTARAQPCDICGAPLRAAHQHLIYYEQWRLTCACDRCSLLLGSQAGSKYGRVVQVIRYLADFDQTDAEWESLGIPISLAFISRRIAVPQLVALYPSPAGATEAALNVNIWWQMAERNPLLNEIQADVEGLLVNRMGGVRDYYWVSIDICLKLTGLIRKHWRGLSGGRALWAEVDEFFVGLKERGASPINDPHA